MDVLRRFLPFLTCLLLGSHAVADDRTEADARMRSAMADLAQQTRLTISLDGLQTVGKQETPFQIVASWSAVPTKWGVPIKLDFRVYRSGLLSQAIVGDGTFLWLYNVDRKEYVCVQYGATDGPPPTDSAQRLVRQLSSRLRGTSAYVVRLLQDAFAPTAAAGTWTPWLPLASIGLDEDAIVTTVGDPPIQRMDYVLSPPDPDSGQLGYRLKSIDFWETGRQGRDARTTHWRLKLTPDALAKGATFRFVPPLDAKPVSEPGRVPDS